MSDVITSGRDPRRITFSAGNEGKTSSPRPGIHSRASLLPRLVTLSWKSRPSPALEDTKFYAPRTINLGFSLQLHHFVSLGLTAAAAAAVAQNVCIPTLSRLSEPNCAGENRHTIIPRKRVKKVCMYMGATYTYAYNICGKFITMAQYSMTQVKSGSDLIKEEWKFSSP